MAEAEEYKQQLMLMAEKLRLVQENHADEKKELNQTIAELQTGLDTNGGGGGLAERVVNLENLFTQFGKSFGSSQPESKISTNPSRHVSGESKEGDVAEDEDDGSVNGKGREQGISLTFGDSDTSPSNLERFISHYDLVDQINRARGVRVWAKPSYRALMLRMAT